MGRIVILGAGESGAGAAVLAKKEGFDVFVSDMSMIKDKYKELLDSHGIEWEEKGHTEEKILNADEIIKSPGIPDNAPIIKKCVAKGIGIISEIEFAGRYTTSKMICITGSNGKTTTTSLIYHIFKNAGYNVGLAGNIGKSLALQVAEDPHEYYIIEISSFQLDIRDHISCPILFLTARIEDTDKVKGFAAGGDDYIVKPFSLMELEARVSAHLRRETRRGFEAQIRFSGELTIDYSERCLFFANKRLGLAKKEFDIVELLSQNPGQVFDKERIYERIWGYDSDGDSNVVAEHIRRIRTKIAVYTNRVYIETVWGCGYKWIK